MKVKLTRWTSEPTLAIEEAAANCYNSKVSKNGRIMNTCYSSGHTSVLEFANFTFHISGVSRALLAQLTRHRHSSFAVRSQRYCDESLYSCVIPSAVQRNDKALATFNEANETIRKAYKSLREVGITAEDARYILTGGCETVLECNMNLRELAHFCNLRLCTRTQWEIRQMAEMMRDEVILVMPDAEKFLVSKCEIHAPYCFCSEHNGCGKHEKLENLVLVPRRNDVQI